VTIARPSSSLRDHEGRPDRDIMPGTQSSNNSQLDMELGPEAAEEEKRKAVLDDSNALTTELWERKCIYRSRCSQKRFLEASRTETQL
jgi:hypothetical protein